MKLEMSGYNCVICSYETKIPHVSELGACRGNTSRFLDRLHHLWKCPQCLTIHNNDPVDFKDIYSDYPMNTRRLDIYARSTLGNLLRRLRRSGLTKKSSILDYGCGNGVFIEYLKKKNYAIVEGYDPFVEPYTKSPVTQFDCVVVNDVIEHVANPRHIIHDCAKLVKPGGLLYIGTADSEPVKMDELEPHIMRLHQPFHRVILSESSLLKLAKETGFEIIGTSQRSYMDTLMPFSNYRFLDEFNQALGHNIDLALKPEAAKIIMTRPKLWFFAFLGYFFPSAVEPAIILRNPTKMH